MLNILNHLMITTLIVTVTPYFFQITSFKINSGYF
jgi:hypothetical protein